MGAKQIPPEVIFSRAANAELLAIWRWNAEHYSESHADEYVRFLKESINQLAVDYRKGRVVRSQPDLRYLVIQRRYRGHGHAAVYIFNSKEVTVSHIFHTAQDWQSKLTEEKQ
jgi:plasmid stabilization system protein ParE